MSNDLSARQQRAAERILEDESLTEDLSDAPARALITWASERASALAGDEQRGEEDLAAALKELRKAVRSAAAAGEDDPAAVVALAEQALGKALGTASQPPQGRPSAQQEQGAPAKEASLAPAPLHQPEEPREEKDQKSEPATTPPAPPEEQTLSEEERYSRWLKEVAEDEQE